MGRPWPQPGEPLFTEEDTALAIALAEEERDTCPACGMPKAWCRENKDGRARFDVDNSFCWASYRLALWQKKQDDEKVDPSTQRATQVSVKFRPGYAPDIDAGLGLSEEDA